MQPQLPITQSHGYGAGHTLPPPNPPAVSVAYTHQQSTVHSPYNDYESRNLPVPEPTPHQYVQAAHSGHSTPLRERPYPSEPSSYSRRGSASGPTRSPDDYVYPSGRPLSVSTTHEGQHYQPQHYAVDHGGGPPYHPHDGPANGSSNHGLPMPHYNDQAYGPSPAHPHDYNPSPVSGHPHVYGASALGASALSAQASYQNMQREKVRNKGHRATQATNQRLDGMEKAMADTQRRSSPGPSPADPTDMKVLPPYPTKQESPVVKPAEQNNRPFVKPAIPKLKELEQTETSPNESSITNSSEPAISNAVVSEDGRHVAISIEHATAAHRLLHWPSIHNIVHRSKYIRQISLGADYVMYMEQRKGVLRLYGWGSGREPNSDAYGSPPGAVPQGGSSPSSSASTRSDDPASPAPSPPDGLWGSGSVPATNGEKQVTTNVGGLTSENLLDIHPLTMRRLLNSYLENFHILHPFLERSRLTRMFERFSMRYNKAEHTLTKTLFAGPASSLALDALKDGSVGAQRTAKRKYSSGHYSASGDPNPLPSQTGTDIRLEHNISTAIVLLVMALGRIAEWKEPLPGPVYVPGDEDSDTPGALRPLYSPTRIQANSRSPPSGIEQSPNSSTYTGTNPSIPSLLSGPRTQTSSPRLVADDISEKPRNVDIIPGLAYYAKATDLLGNLFGLNDLTQVQAHLLAGLFAGQLARTFESWSWIHSACIACRFIVRESHLHNEKESRKDLIKFAFWTCSQLESDILAELDLPRSGIQNITLDYPKGFMDDFEKADMPDSAIPNQTIMWYYSGQIHIRNMLNDIQSELYPPEDKERAVRGTALRDHFDSRLRAWRELLPIGLQWSDNDPPSSDINTARLRAKYYGAQYIIHRPFLRHALDNNMDFQESPSPHVNVVSHQHRSSSISPQAMERKNSNMGPPGQTAKEKIHQAEILHSARTCVAAAIQSTEAFDNIINRQRLIVTNIFGTAHAQFGNMLVLATTYKSHFAFLISKSKLEHLFRRTINFLRSLGAVSKTLARDAMILERLQEVVFDEGNLRHSFSSDMS
ncbi:MAG: hypothetical protein Q9166_002082 [cf. Caloplaca sp. 2 TL-2023]